MKRYSKPLVATMVAIMALAPAASAFADSGYYVDGKKYLSSDVSASKELLLKLNNEPGLATDLAVDLNGARAVYKDFMNTKPSLSNLTQAFQQYAAANPFEVPAGTVIVKPDGTTIVDPDAGQATDLKIESVSANNLTSVVVTFNNKVEKVEKDNFKIQGTNVKAVSLGEDFKTVTLSVDKMEYSKNYTLIATNIVVSGKVQPDSQKAFVTKGVADLWELKITADSTLTADGITTGVVKFELLDENGKIDTSANDIVLDLNSTYGYLSQKRVTIQNGVAEVILRSEFVADSVTAKIDAQIIEAKSGSEYKDLIGKVFATQNVKFVPVGAEDGGETVLIKSLSSANTNEADRVTLLFDEAVSPSDFYTINPVNGNVELRNGAVTVSQMSDLSVPKEVVGYLFDSSNKKKVIAVLKNDETNGYLTDNKDVYVSAQIGKGSAVQKQFKLADARVPNATGVTVANNNTLVATFSEPILKANFVIDARFAGNDLHVTYGDLKWENGQFVDYRNQVTISLTDTYQEPDKDKDDNFIYPAGFFKPGVHSLEVSSIYDFAANSDTNNIGTTQSLVFNIAEDNAFVEVTQTIDSPEQFRVSFDKTVKILKGNVESNLGEVAEFQVFKKATVVGEKDDWVAVDGVYFANAAAEVDFTEFLKYTDLGNGSHKFEVTSDWTQVYDTAATKDNYYNDEFRLVLPEGSVVTASNGKKNAEKIILPLTSIDGKKTALATPDVESPKIKDIVKTANFDAVANPTFVVTMTEPVKLLNHTDEAGETLAQGQASLPETKVEFLGKDKDGKVRTFKGSIVEYADQINDKIIVRWDNANGIETPQNVVDQKDNTNTTWTIVVKSISDDVGNTAPTATRNFELVKTPGEVPSDSIFRVLPTTGTAIGEDGTTATYAVQGFEGAENDTIEITYTEAVAVTGLGSATDVKNYTLNGNSLPAGTSISLARDAANDVNDKKVVITLNGKILKTSNVITLARQIKSKEGKDLREDVAFTFAKVNSDAAAALQDAINAVATAESVKTQASVDAAQALVTLLPDETAAKAGLQDRINAVQGEIDVATADLQTAKGLVEGVTFTGLQITDGDAGTDADKKTAVETAINGLVFPTGVDAAVNENGSEITLSKTGAADVIVTTSATFVAL